MKDAPAPTWQWPRLRGRWVFWTGAFFLLNALWRALVVVLDLRASGNGTPWPEPFLWELTSGVVVWLLIPLVQVVVLNAPWRDRGLRFLALHLGGAVAFWLLHVAGLWSLRLVLYPRLGWGAYHYGEILPRVLMEGGKDLFTFATFAAVLHALEARRARQARELATARLETELREARLQALAAQLDPHFLFNALNTLSSVMYEDLGKADRLFAALGQMLRDTLEASGPTWTLARERAHLDAFLAFAEARFGDRLRVVQAWDPGLGDLMVPRLVLQRLVENALKHNAEAAGRVLALEVEARRRGADLWLRVADDGAGFAPGSEEGVGLSNLRRSLGLLHGDRARLDLDSAPGGGARITLLLPAEPRHG